MLEKPQTWTALSSREIADCRVFRVREDECVRDGDQISSRFFVIENPDWVNVVAVTSDGQIVLIEQFRHGTGSLILEIPGGMVDPGEFPEAAAARELLEETGYSAGMIRKIGTSHPNPAIQNNTIHHFLALNCSKTSDVVFDDHESIATCLAPLHELENLVHNGNITHSLAITAIYYAERYLRNEGLIT